MEKFTKVSGFAAPIPLNNVNTDMISPKNVMKSVTKKGLGWGLFQEYRNLPNGDKNPDFVLNKKPWSSAKIIVSLNNWGCGSSREHAPWAMHGFGIRSVIAISFADIHYNNCFKNGILPVQLLPDEIKHVMNSAEAGEEMTVDLQKNVVSLADGTTFHFNVSSFYRDSLLSGADEIDYTLAQITSIERFEKKQRKLTPWLFDRVLIQYSSESM